MDSERKESPVGILVPFVILVDGREKAPYTFAGLRADSDKDRRQLMVQVEWAHLHTGDYTIKGMESLVAVERKSLADCYSTLGQNRKRFEEEHKRLSTMEFAAVVIESSMARMLAAPPPESRLLPKSVYRTALSWPQRYGVHWIWADDRRLAEITTFRLLEKFYQHKHENDPKPERRKRRGKEATHGIIVGCDSGLPSGSIDSREQWAPITADELLF
jgi:DNA excision repair protein ERCC-4